MRITYSQLQKELFNKQKHEENLKKRVSKLRTDLLTYRSMERGLIEQYERIVKEYRVRYEEVIKNGWKIVIAKIIIWYNKLRGR